MLTDRPPRRPALLAEFFASDRLGTLELLPDDRLCAVARTIEEGMKTGRAAPVRQACAEFLTVAAEFYQVENPTLRVLSARPIRVREGGWASELFGDYHPATKVIRVWMRTAVRMHPAVSRPDRLRRAWRRFRVAPVPASGQRALSQLCGPPFARWVVDRRGLNPTRWSK
jgi:hypothetical protein